MDWRWDRVDAGRLSAQLLWWYHKLERGLVTPGSADAPLRFFGAEAAAATCRIMRQWEAAGCSQQNPVYVGAVETLRSYRERLNRTPPPAAVAAELIAAVEERLQGTSPDARLTTPIPYRATEPTAHRLLEEIACDRRSVRHFDGRPVDLALVRRAAAVAQFAPSACNRQPWRLHLFQDKVDIAALLALQNGNDGFGHTIPLLGLLTVDHAYFYGAVERIAPTLDAGLFLMGLLLALQAQGLASCCLNWNVMPARNVEAHRISGIPPNEKIVTFLAIGVAAPATIVPLSPRRAVDEIIISHGGGA